MRIRTRSSYPFALCLVLLLPVSRSLRAQSSAESLADALRQENARRALILRNFSALQQVRARVETGSVAFAPTENKSFSAIHFNHVSLKQQTLTLLGTKSYLVRDGGGQLARFDEQEPVTLVLDVDPGFDPTTIPDVLSQLFFSKASEAIGAIPSELSAYVPEKAADIRTEGKPPRSTPPSQAGCDCQDAHPRCPDGGPVRGLTLPKLLHQTDLQMPPGTPPNSSLQTRAAARIRVDGTMGEVWMLHASNAGAATSTFTAVRGYRFQPAACHGVPVETTLVMDQNFTKH